MAACSQEVKAKLEAERTDPEKKVQVGDVAKALGALWKTLSDEDKAPYNEAVKGTRVLSPAALWRHALLVLGSQVQAE